MYDSRRCLNVAYPLLKRLLPVIVPALLLAACGGDGGGGDRPAEFEAPPDGGSIAFSFDKDGNFDLYVLGPDAALTRLTDHFAFDLRPDWSPDDRRIAFDSERDGKAEIYVMNADGSGQTRLTDSPGFDGGPGWSPAP